MSKIEIGTSVRLDCEGCKSCGMCTPPPHMARWEVRRLFNKGGAPYALIHSPQADFEYRCPVAQLRPCMVVTIEGNTLVMKDA